ncbi:hypothetical protein EDD27_9519 [Nonomuraea polychroma]|uniref:WD40 repeat protein n=1 Tax=Nonomuraea polychroma TaxID=46176 RepID=A0A438MLK2_9ACTN|nr:hypothetical protein [Nonomuraea polychroma]RVX46627.1 hypothetical protein EDD27_9519 [Nonomuraea polychroma]
MTLGALLLAGVTLIAQPAAAATPGSIAYAQATQTWQLVLTNGDVVEVPEALVKTPKDWANGGEEAPFLISGDGRHFFYYRKSDGLFVTRTLNGKERVVSRKITGVGIDEEWPLVSDDGSYVVTTTSGPGLGIFVDLRNGKVIRPPGKMDTWGFHGFTPDSKRLLLSGDRLTVFDRGLRARMRLKTRLSPWALANDYVTAAEPVGTSDKYRKLRLLNLRTGRVGSTVTLQLPRGQYIDDLDFDQAGRLIVRSRTKTGVATYRVSKATGKVTLLRTVARPDADAWVLPGDESFEWWTLRKTQR